MYKLRQLIGLPVLEIESGTQIGEVQEVVLNIGQAIVLGVIITGATWFSNDQGILFSDFHGIGRDALTIRSPEAVTDLADTLSSHNFCRLQELCDKAVYTEAGNYLGLVVDVIYQPDTGEIRFYELSDGLITDLIQGRLVMPLPQAQVLSEERVIVPDAMSKLLHAAKEIQVV